MTATILKALGMMTRLFLDNNTNSSVFSLGHDHLALFEDVICGYLSEAFLSCFPQNVVKF
jgi:hypothetical protein